MEIKTLTPQSLEHFKNKRVLIRFDFNVPLKDGVIKDSTRIDLALPTIKKVLEANPLSITLMSHLGRPKGKVNEDLSLAPIGDYLAKELNMDIYLTEKSVDCGEQSIMSVKRPKIILLENLRFHPEETANDDDFAKKLSAYGEIYINDAFGALHRKHASTYQIQKYFPHSRYMGPLVEAELKNLKAITANPKRPFLAILGGAKIKDKIKTIEKLLPQVDQILIGGAMAYAFLKQQGHEIGNSLCDDEDLPLAKDLLAQDKSNKLVLPIDHITATSPNETKTHTTSDANIAIDQSGFDIGPKTVEYYQKCISGKKTIFWNGPMGMFEKSLFSNGTILLAKEIAATDCFSVVGGGDSVNAIKQAKLEDGFSHISTGGGASLEFIEKGTLPGIQALAFGVE